MKKIIFTLFLLFLSNHVFALTFVDGKEVKPEIEKINKLERTLKAVLFELEAAKLSNSELSSNNKSLSQEIIVLNKDIADLADNIQNTSTAINNTNTKYSALFQKFNKLNQKHISLNATNNKLQTDLKELKTNNEILALSNVNLKNQTSKGTDTIDADTKKIESDLLRYKQLNSNLNKQLTALQASNNNQSSNISDLKIQLKKQSILMSKDNNEKSTQLLKDIESLQNDLSIVKKSNNNLTLSISKLKSINEEASNKLIQVNIRMEALLTENERLGAEIISISDENDELIESQYLFSTVNYYLIFSTLFGFIVGVIISLFFARIARQKREDFYNINRSY